MVKEKKCPCETDTDPIHTYQTKVAQQGVSVCLSAKRLNCGTSRPTAALNKAGLHALPCK